MIAAYASLALVCVASVVVGQAVLSLCGRRDVVWLSGPVGLAGLLVVAGIAADLPGHAATIAAALVALGAVSTAVLLVGRRRGGHPGRSWRFSDGMRPKVDTGGAFGGLAAALLAVLVASIPFIVAGRVGILGVGLVNDDMASHLLLTSWLDERFSPEPVLIDQGYPLGPHALVAGLAKGLGTNPIDSFAGLTLALPALTALVAFGALERLGTISRTLAATATALPYLTSAYLAQEAFKEPIMALFLIAFALWLPSARAPREAIPLGLLAAGAIYVYSFPGLAWLMGTVAIWAAIELIRHRGDRGRALRAALPGCAAAAIALLVLIAPDLGRVLDFADFRALDPDRANEGGLGNLRGHLSPLEALGVWPTSEFRLSAGAGSLPALVFYVGAALGATALALGLPRWIRRHGPAVPAALAAAALVYIAARSQGTVYTSAKALAIASPLISIIALGGLLDPGWGGVRAGEAGPRQAAHAPPSARTLLRNAYRPALATALLLGAALSSFLVLRQAPVGPEDHLNELAQIRPLVEGEKVLFLGRDNFVLYELRGSKPFTHVRNFYDPYFVKPNFELRRVGSKFDFDAVEAATLERFPYVITTRASYASGPPPGYEPALITDSYALWRQGASVGGRRPVEPGPEPSGRLRCQGEKPKGEAAAMLERPVLAPPGDWAPSTTVEDGASARITIDLPPGRWLFSLQYDSTRPIELRGPGMSAALPGNLDYRGITPFWAAGRLEVERRGPITFEVSVERPPLAGRLLGAHSVAHLGGLAATSESQGYVNGLPRFAPDYPGSDPVVLPAYPGSSAFLVPARLACGREADWIKSAGP